MKVLVVTGSSGGHIFPALTFLDALKARHPDISTVLVLPKRNAVSRIGPDYYALRYISITNIGVAVDLKNLKAIFNFFKGSLESIFIIMELRPDIVVGFGSLASIPMVLCAWLCRIKILIHEQNVIPGRAVRFLAGFADRVAISFVETKDLLKVRKDKIVLTGNPVRRKLTRCARPEALDFFGLDPSRFTILVMGGSQGSRRINLSFLKSVATISAKDKIQIIHLCGERDSEFLKNSYKDLQVEARVFVFLEDMQYAYSASDLVLSRAGATTLSELIFFKIPAVIVPYPFAYKHQLANAKVLENAGAGVIMQDADLDSGILSNTINDLIGNSVRISKMRFGYDNIAQNNVEEALVESVLGIGKSGS